MELVCLEMGMGYVHLWKKLYFYFKNGPTNIGIVMFVNGVGFHYEKKGSFATCLATHCIYGATHYNSIVIQSKQFIFNYYATPL